jgi:hypothetical protein
MFARQWRNLSAWVVCGAALTLTAPRAEAQRDLSSVNTPLGQAVVEYRDKAIQMVAAYNYSQRNHDSPWLLIEAGLTGKDAIINRGDIVLRTPQGRDIPLASQRRVGEDASRIARLLQQSSVVRHDVPSYFNQRDRIEGMRLFTLPFGSVVHDSFVVDRDRVAIGPLFFESPTGAWADGTYALVVRLGEGTAELPIHLE